MKRDNGDGSSPSLLHFFLSPVGTESPVKVDSGGKASRRLCSREGNSSAPSTRCLINDLHSCRTHTHTHAQGSCQLPLSADGGLELPLQASAVCADSDCCCIIPRPVMQPQHWLWRRLVFRAKTHRWTRRTPVACLSALTDASLSASVPFGRQIKLSSRNASVCVNLSL